MGFQIRLTADAERDLASLYEYIVSNDSIESAKYVFEKIKATLDDLRQSPARGSYVKELMSLGIKQYREVYFKPYRIIYRILDEAVIVYVIADGRRNMQTLLQSRLLR